MALEIARLTSHRYDAGVNNPNAVNRVLEVVRARTEQKGIESQPSAPSSPYGTSDRPRAIGAHTLITLDPDLTGEVIFGPGRMNNQEPFGASHSVRLGTEGGYNIFPPATRGDIEQPTRPQQTVDIRV